MKPLRMFALVVLVAGAGLADVAARAGLAEAADKGKARARKTNGAGKAKSARPKPAPAAEAPVEDAPTGNAGAAPATASGAASEANATNPTNPANPDRPRAGRPRVYTFGGLDLEGKLKTPQLLYFRGRMRQELDASSLQRRSFLKELEKTADDQGL